MNKDLSRSLFMNKDNNVMERLNRSEVYADYQRAFGEATELPTLSLLHYRTTRMGHVACWRIFSASLPNNKCFQPV